MAMRGESSELRVESTPRSRETDQIERGRVGQVRQQFQIHEDTAFAYKIQSEEIQNHVSRNREQRKSVRDNVKTAKQTYLEEVKIAGVLPERSVAEIEQKQWLADELHRRVEEQEKMTKVHVERQRREDEEIAMQLQRDEEMKQRYLERKRLEKLAKAEEEHRNLRRIMKELETANLSDHSDNDEDTRRQMQSEDSDLLWQLPQEDKMITLADGTVIDAKHNEVQTEEQKRQHMQKRDEELAKILQEQEDLQIKKQKNIHEDLRKAIELQDREIAKHLQRQEKAKAEKRRERIRRGQSMPERDELTSSNRRHLPTYHQAVGIDDFEKEESRHHRSGHERRSESPEERNVRMNHRKTYEDRREDVWIPRDDNDKSGTTESTREIERDRNEAGAHYNNIAETLDPTFQRVSRRSSSPLTDENGERQMGGKSAQIVPPLKRKTKDKTKREKEKDCKQQ